MLNFSVQKFSSCHVFFVARIEILTLLQHSKGTVYLPPISSINFNVPSKSKKSKFFRDGMNKKSRRVKYVRFTRIGNRTNDRGNIMDKIYIERHF